MRKLSKLKSIEEINARKKMKKAIQIRKQRKTPYPFGFEYKKW